MSAPAQHVRVASSSSDVVDVRSPHHDPIGNMEWKIHECSTSLWSTFKDIFPDLRDILPRRSEVLKAKNTENEKEHANLQLVTIWQPTEFDMSGFAAEVEDERDAKTSKFLKWATGACVEIKQCTDCKFVDCVDPSSGLPYLCKRGSTVFIETEDAISNLGYQIIDFGCCKAVSHPRWGTKSFLSIIVTDAAPEKLHTVMLSLDAHK